MMGCDHLKSKVSVFKREKVRQCLMRWFQKLVLFSVITCALYLPLMSSNLQTCSRQDWSKLCCKSQLSSIAKSFYSQILKISSNLNISEDFNFTYPTKNNTYLQEWQPKILLPSCSLSECFRGTQLLPGRLDVHLRKKVRVRNAQISVDAENK